MNNLVSIILPVFNGEKYLFRSISSLLSQSYKNIELIIINDGSNDSSANIVQSFSDQRIRYFTQKNIGLAKSLNRGIGLSKGKYIARQDQDDFSEFDRIRLQFNFLEANSAIAMVGSGASIWVDDIKTKRKLLHPCSDSQIKIGLLFYNVFVHSSVMIRRSALLDIGGYSESADRQPPEDFELWSRISRQFQLANLPELLVNYTEVNSSMSRSTNLPFVANNIKFSIENLLWAIDSHQISPSIVGLANLMHRNYIGVPKNLSYSTFNTLLQQSISNVSKRYNIPQNDALREIKMLKIKLKIFYLDFLFNGLISYIFLKLKLLKKLFFH